MLHIESGPSGLRNSLKRARIEECSEECEDESSEELSEITENMMEVFQNMRISMSDIETHNIKDYKIKNWKDLEECEGMIERLKSILTKKFRKSHVEKKHFKRRRGLSGEVFLNDISSANSASSEATFDINHTQCEINCGSGNKDFPQSPEGKKYWLFKSEPESRMHKGVDVKFGIDDLKMEPKQTTSWNCIRVHKSRNFLRDEIMVGDQALIYHSNCKQPGIVGIVDIVKSGYPDSSQFLEESPYFDSNIKKDNPIWYSVDVKFNRMLRKK